MRAERSEQATERITFVLYNHINCDKSHRKTMYRNATHKHSRTLSLLCSPQLPYTSPITYNIPHKVITPSFYIHASICRRDGAAAVGATGKSGTKMKVDEKSFHRRRSTTVVDGFSASPQIGFSGITPTNLSGSG